MLARDVVDLILKTSREKENATMGPAPSQVSLKIMAHGLPPHVVDYGPSFLGQSKLYDDLRQHRFSEEATEVKMSKLLIVSNRGGDYLGRVSAEI